MADQQWWTRERRVVRGTYRSNDTRESVHWRDAVSQIDQAATKLAPDTKLHFLADREADASLFIEQGWPPKKIQTMLGHSSITMTYDVYGHLFHDSAKDVDLMGEMERGLLAA